jgi:hypothetical protein
MKLLYQGLLGITRAVVRRAAAAAARSRRGPSSCRSRSSWSSGSWHKRGPACSVAIPTFRAQGGQPL